MTFLYITSECNNDCEYCCSKNLRGKKQFLSYEEVEHFLDWLDSDVEENNIYITGGEPTLHPDLKKILNRCSFFTKTTLMTNLLCSKELIKDLLEINYITWNISTNPKKELENTFIENLDYLLSQKNIIKENKNTIGLSITLYENINENAKNINKIFSLLEKYNEVITYVEPRIAMPVSDGKKYELTNHTEQVSMIVSNINNLYPQINIKFTKCAINNCQIAPALYGKLLENPKVSNLGFTCKYNSSIAILPDKSQLPCPYFDLKFKTNEYKNFPKGNIAKHWNLNRLTKYRNPQSFRCACSNLICQEQGCCTAIMTNILERN